MRLIFNFVELSESNVNVPSQSAESLQSSDKQKTITNFSVKKLVYRNNTQRHIQMAENNGKRNKFRIAISPPLSIHLSHTGTSQDK
jgi:hypothetical protein